MKRQAAVLSLCVASVLPAAASAAAKFSWFDDVPAARDSLGLLRTPPGLINKDTRFTVGLGAYQALDPFAHSDASDGGSVLRVYGEVGVQTDLLYAPLANLDRVSGTAPGLFESNSSRLAGFGVKWQHRVDAANSFALSAGYSESAWATLPVQSSGVLDTRAALSWTSTGAGSLRPGITGSVFVGDETPRDDAYQRLSRRYYGFAVGGQVTVFDDHTPYLSFRTRRPLDNGLDDPALLLIPDDPHSLVSAGWKWQVQPNWSLQAEASYGLNGTPLEPYTPDRSRFFFGTRFDFR